MSLRVEGRVFDMSGIDTENPVSGVTYPIVSHWVWSPDGWLVKIGFSDFSGAGVVHLLAGTCSFVAALFIGPRIGRFDSITSNQYNGHSMPVRRSFDTMNQTDIKKK